MSAGARGPRDDVTTRWRQVLCYLGRAGAAAKIKRMLRRRDRRACNEGGGLLPLGRVSLGLGRDDKE